ncbi:MAG: carboxylesterase/lipase family protein [Cellulomonadaceae bacterium]
MSDTHGPRARTAAGGVRGAAANGLATFRGIPYAAAPVGPLRWRAPAPAIPWTGVRSCIEYGAVPPQPVPAVAVAGKRVDNQSEDCLTLNVATPLDALEAGTNAAGLPVVVHLHSGSYVPGSVSVPAFDGSTLASTGDMVYVSVNHRIGALGYLDLSDRSVSERRFESNLALRDQVAALEWVRDNIAAFGGDPGNVTLLGTSRGATAVTTLLCVPAAAGLFARAVAQSPAPYSAQEHDVARRWADAFVDLLGADVADAAQVLDTASAAELVAAAERLTAYAPDELPGALWTSPVVDDFLPELPAHVFASGRSHRVPLLIGTTKYEGGAFVTPRPQVLPDTAERQDLMFEAADPTARYRVLPAYPGYPSRKARFQLAGDALFWVPSVRVAADHARVAPTYVYRYDFTTAALNLVGLDAVHGAEIVPVFGLADTAAGRSMTALGGGRDLESLSNRMQLHWFSFVRTGTPRETWPAYDARDRPTMVFARTDRVIADPGTERRVAWGDFPPAPRWHAIAH